MTPSIPSPRPSFWLILVGAVACVPQARYDGVKAELDRAAQGRDDGRRQVAELELQVAALKQRVLAAEGSLETERENLAQARFEHDVVTREREDAKQLSDQLLTELERIGGHLRTYAEDKALLDEQRAGLAEELEAARSRLAALAADEQASQQRFRAARELTLALSEPLERRALRLVLVDGEIAIQFSKAAAFRAKSPTLSEEGQAALEKAASVLGPLDFRVEVEQPGDDPSAGERAEVVRAVLVEHGLVPERVILASAGEPSADEAAVRQEAEATEEAEVRVDAAPVAQPVARTENDSEIELELRLRWPEAGAQSLGSG